MHRAVRLKQCTQLESLVPDTQASTFSWDWSLHFTMTSSYREGVVGQGVWEKGGGNVKAVGPRLAVLLDTILFYSPTHIQGTSPSKQ